jgi:predicted nucleic acid-binding protein
VFLDTSFCIDAIREKRRGKRGPATRKLQELEGTPLFISVFALCELDAGARMSRDPEQELKDMAQFARGATTVYPDLALPAAYGQIEAHLRTRGTPIPTMDILIGAMAKLAGQPLLVRHPEHFALIPGLVVETYC